MQSAPSAPNFSPPGADGKGVVTNLPFAIAAPGERPTTPAPMARPATPPYPLGTAFGERQNLLLFWDIENVRVPDGKTAAEVIQCLQKTFAGLDTGKSLLKIVISVTENGLRTIQKQDPGFLKNNVRDVQVIIAARNDKQDADFMLTKEMQLWVDMMDYHNTRIVLVSGAEAFFNVANAAHRKGMLEGLVYEERHVSPPMLTIAVDVKREWKRLLEQHFDCDLNFSYPEGQEPQPARPGTPQIMATTNHEVSFPKRNFPAPPNLDANGPRRGGRAVLQPLAAVKNTPSSNGSSRHNSNSGNGGVNTSGARAHPATDPCHICGELGHWKNDCPQHKRR